MRETVMGYTTAKLRMHTTAAFKHMTLQCTDCRSECVLFV